MLLPRRVDAFTTTQNKGQYHCFIFMYLWKCTMALTDRTFEVDMTGTQNIGGKTS